MKRRHIFRFILFSLTIVMLSTSCKNKDIGIDFFKIEKEKVFPESDGVSISGLYSFLGEVKGMSIHIGQLHDLTDAKSYEMQLNDKRFSITVDELYPVTIYYYCYSIDFGYSENHITEIKSFITLKGRPVVKTKDAIAIDSTTFHVKCEVISDGGATLLQRGVCWNTSGDPNLNDYHVNHGENGLGEYTCLISGLQQDMDYFVRAYAINEEGIRYGNILQFRTGILSGLPTVTTSEATDITATTATCGGNVTSDGGSIVTERGICWSTSHNPTLNNYHIGSGSGTGIFTAEMLELNSNTTYYVRAYATNNTGTAYGNEVHFTTESGEEPHDLVNVNITANPAIIPNGNSSQLTALASGGDGNYTYSWTPTISLDNAYIQSPIASPTATTTYTCIVTSYGNTASNSCTIIVVNAPTNLQATVQNENDVQLNWFAANPAQSYKVYRNEVLIAQNISTTSYTDNNLGVGTYSYQVSTFYEGVESPKSNVATVTIDPSMPGIPPEGALLKEFSVGPNKKVWFSNGNLQYQASTRTWRFAEHQWDYVGKTPYGTVYENNVQCNNELISQTYEGWIDLFGWGTSGYDHGATCFQPWSTSSTDSLYYAYRDWQHNLYDFSGRADWGYNAIVNGGNEEHKGWRTLTSSEWDYLLIQRQTPSNIRYAKAMVHSIKGLVILPDDWDASIYLYGTNDSGSNYDSNPINDTTWDEFESKGAVFLPAGGRRNNTSIYNLVVGYYWSSDQGGETKAYYLYFLNGTLDAKYGGSRHNGNSVRLVFDKQ